MIRSIGISLLALPLAGCFITGQSGDLVTIKPSAMELQGAVREAVCDSFRPITFSGKHDTPDTVKEVREHNAALGAFKCASR